jgi:hypothetical protein
MASLDNYQLVEQQVNAVYRKILNRDGDPDGVKCYVTEFMTSRLDATQLERVFLDSDEFYGHFASMYENLTANKATRKLYDVHYKPRLKCYDDIKTLVYLKNRAAIVRKHGSLGKSRCSLNDALDNIRAEKRKHIVTLYEALLRRTPSSGDIDWALGHVEDNSYTTDRLKTEIMNGREILNLLPNRVMRNAFLSGSFSGDILRCNSITEVIDLLYQQNRQKIVDEYSIDVLGKLVAVPDEHLVSYEKMSTYLAKRRFQPRVGVFVHLFNSQLLDVLQRSVEAICDEYSDVLVIYTVPQGVPVSAELESWISKRGRLAKIIEVSNVGMDIGGFFRAVEWTMREEEYKNLDWIVKLHSKTDDMWRSAMLAAVTNKSAEVRCGLRDPAIGCISASRYLYWNDGLNNRPILDICSKLGVKVPFEYHFAAGSIFWLRWPLLTSYLERITFDEIFSKFINYRPHINDEENQFYEHAWERLLSGIIPSDAGLKHLTIDETGEHIAILV